MPNHYLSIFGWCDFENIYRDAVDEFDDCVFLEIGGFQGRSSVYMCEYIKEKNKNIKLVTLDMFPTKEELDVYKNIDIGQGAEYAEIMSLPKSLLETFVENTVKAGVDDINIPIKSNSHKPHILFQDEFFPFIFVDAGHSESIVTKDLELWWPKVRSGGVIAGHDWASDGVNRAVKKFFDSLGLPIEVSISSWRVRKPAQ